MANPTAFQLDPLDASFGAVVTELKLSELGADAFSELYAAWLEYALLIFPTQHLTKEEQTRFAQRFGELELDLFPISNVRADGSVIGDDDGDSLIKLIKGNQGWHCDSTYTSTQSKGAVFTAHVVPPTGGETGWADLRAGYGALEDATKARIADLSAYHSLAHAQAKIGYEPQSDNLGDHYEKDSAEFLTKALNESQPPLRPLVKVHPETSRTCLNVGRHAYGIPGLDPDESERLIQELVDTTCQSPRVHHHAWQPGDAVIWDNRCLMHRLLPWDMNEPRVMYHARIAGSPETEFAAHA